MQIKPNHTKRRFVVIMCQSVSKGLRFSLEPLINWLETFFYEIKMSFPQTVTSDPFLNIGNSHEIDPASPVPLLATQILTEIFLILFELRNTISGVTPVLWDVDVSSPVPDFWPLSEYWQQPWNGPSVTTVQLLSTQVYNSKGWELSADYLFHKTN